MAHYVPLLKGILCTNTDTLVGYLHHYAHDPYQQSTNWDLSVECAQICKRVHLNVLSGL